VPLLATWLLLWSGRLVRDGELAVLPRPGHRILVASAVVVVAFGVLRWLPQFAVLAP